MNDLERREIADFRGYFPEEQRRASLIAIWQYAVDFFEENLLYDSAVACAPRKSARHGIHSRAKKTFTKHKMANIWRAPRKCDNGILYG
jgi:hypothetical protein